MGLAPKDRCWKYAAGGCRAKAMSSLRRGDHVYRYCDDPAHDPRTISDHMHALDAWVEEAAADLGMDPDTVWHDVAVSYLTIEVHDLTMRADLARGLGLPADVVGA